MVAITLYSWADTGGTYSRFYNQTGFLQGGTYTFDQSDSSNTSHPFRFSETQDGTHTTGGTDPTAGYSIWNTQHRRSDSSSSRRCLHHPFSYYCSTHPGIRRFTATQIDMEL